MRSSVWLAHSAGISGLAQSMRDHVGNVTTGAEGRCPSFLRQDARLAGLLHDFGKYSELFRLRLEGKVSGLDHWAPGAHLLLKYELSDLAAATVHGHHVGLGAWALVSHLKNELCSIEGRNLTISDREQLEVAFRALTQDGFDLGSCVRGRKLKGTVSSMLDARMVLSALVDADYSDTAHHMRGVKRPEATRFDAGRALDSVEQYIARLSRDASPKVLDVRQKLRHAAQERAEQPPGLFTLEAPTGSGKTLAMLEFALRQMARPGSGLRRVVVVLPFLSILDQTVREYRNALGDQADAVFEHHSLAEWRRPLTREEDENGGEVEGRRRSAAEAFSEDWLPPVVITTTVQFFESLFTDHPSTARKLCSIPNSVVLVDEVQTLPGPLLLATVRSLSRLAHSDYGCSIVLSTATQPLLSHFDEAVTRESGNAGWKPISITTRADGLYEKTRRYRIDWSRCDPLVKWASVANEISKLDRVLCIVNTRKDARRLAEMVLAIRPRSPVRHLSANMCAAHRRVVIDDPIVKDRKAPCILISTQCVEAGVDLDFPTVYRALAPLDSIAQAAGRCNRAGKSMGMVRVFKPEDARYPGDRYRSGADETLSLLQQQGDLDPQDPSVFDRFFRLLHSSEDLPGTTLKLENAIRERDFPLVANIYRLIEHRDVVHVLVPYADAPEVPERITRAFSRDAQPFVVDANRRDARASIWLDHPIVGLDDWYVLCDWRAYDVENNLGLMLDLELPCF